jgi:hypothetical protein
VIRRSINERYVFRSKFEAGKLLGHFRFTKESVLSTELNGDFAVISQNSGISLLRTFCLTRPKRRKTLTTIKLDYALERAARLFNDRIYVVSSGPYPDQKQVSIVNPKSEWKVNIECPLIDNDNVYFTIDQNKLLAKGSYYEIQQYYCITKLFFFRFFNGCDHSTNHPNKLEF